MWAAAIGDYLVGQVIEIRLLAHLARLRWAKSLISTLIATAWALVANNYANLADVACAVRRVSRVEADTSTVGGDGDDWCSVGVGVPVVHSPCGCVERNTVVTLSGWLAHVVRSPGVTSSTGLGGGGWVLSLGALMFG